MGNVLTQLGEISVDEFLQEYWQQKPLLIRQAFPKFSSPLSPDELAGLSLEEEIESRLILENHQGSPWQLRCGPFSEEAFQNLPERNWTLLVQALDLYIPELQQLRQRFQFLPDWRLDDVMASYAVDGGSVGPHYDHYDVFLLQGMGKRHWQIGQVCDQQSEQLEGTSLNILQDFHCVESYVLEPGDMLYLPPKVAHWGIAQGECITYSVGFRAPSQALLIEEFFQSLEPQFNEFLRYEDPGLEHRAHPHEICDEDLLRVAEILQQRLRIKTKDILDWFGPMASESKYPQDDYIPPNNFSAVPERISKSPETRCCFYRHKAGHARLYVNGRLFHCSAEMAIMLCEQDNFSSSELYQSCEDPQQKSALEETLLALLNSGCFYESDED